MKKIFVLVAAAAALALGACNKENAEVIVPSEGGKVSLNVSFDVTSPDPSTKAVKSGWESGDIIYCWFDENQSKDPDLTLTYDGSAWNASDVDATIVANLKEEGNLKFFWIGTNDLGDWTYDNGKFRPAVGKGFPRMLRPSANGSDNVYQYDADTKTLSATLKWTYASNFQVVVTGLSLDDNFTFRCEGADLYTIGSVLVNESNISRSLGDIYDYGVVNSDGVAFNMFLSNGGEKTFNFVLKGPDNTRYVYSVNKTIELGSTAAENNFFAVKIAKEKFIPTINGKAYVEMGNGLKWATMNVGGADPTDDGDFYAWGVTEPTEGFTWGSYKWASIPAGVVDSDGWRYLTKYTYDDGETSAIWYDAEKNYIGDNDVDYSSHGYEDDAARQKWGATWRTPTSADWNWLIDNCTWAWVDNYEGTSVSGMLVTSNVEGYTDCSIFLPAAQHPQSTGFAGGDYWAADLATSWNSSSAKFLHFAYDDFGGNKRMNIIPRNELLVIRPVSD